MCTFFFYTTFTQKTTTPHQRARRASSGQEVSSCEHVSAGKTQKSCQVWQKVMEPSAVTTRTRGIFNLKAVKERRRWRRGPVNSPPLKAMSGYTLGRNRWKRFLPALHLPPRRRSVKIMHREGCHSRNEGLPIPERRGCTLGASTRRGDGEVINLIRADSGFFSRWFE